MPAPDWKKIKDVFHEALRFEADERERFLERECGHNVEMRIEVESLLLSLDEANDFLEQPAMGQPVNHDGWSELPAGHEVSHYKIISHIATGGMGEIYLAEDQKLRRKVALKILHDVMPASAEQLRRFQREAAVVSSLNHPNILTIYDIDTENGIHLFASEFVNGITLRERLRSSPLNFDEALGIAIQTLSALQAAHDAGIIHRDIKPENIMIRVDGLVKVLDFGLAKVAKQKNVDGSEPTWEQIFSRPGMIIGTAAYMSPEQARGQRIDARSDIFSFGVVLYEMLVGKAPFDGQTATDVIASLIQDNVRPPSLINRGLPPEIDQIVLKMLEKDRDDRYPNAGEPLSGLTRIKDMIGRSDKMPDAKPDEPAKPEPAKPPNVEKVPAGLSPLYLLLIAAIILIAAAAVYFSS